MYKRKRSIVSTFFIDYGLNSYMAVHQLFLCPCAEKANQLRFRGQNAKKKKLP